MERLPMETLEIIIGIQKTTLEAFEKHGSEDSDYCPTYDKAVLMLLEELKQYRIAEEQGLLLIEPCDVEDIIDKLFSHNERVSLWVSVKEEITYHQLIYSGMAWDIPEVFKSCYFVKIFGTIPEKITQADIINIEVVLTKEAEQALARIRMEK